LLAGVEAGQLASDTIGLPALLWDVLAQAGLGTVEYYADQLVDYGAYASAEASKVVKGKWVAVNSYFAPAVRVWIPTFWIIPDGLPRVAPNPWTARGQSIIGSVGFPGQFG